MQVTDRLSQHNRRFDDPKPEEDSERFARHFFKSGGVMFIFAVFAVISWVLDFKTCTWVFGTLTALSFVSLVVSIFRIDRAIHREIELEKEQEEARRAQQPFESDQAPTA